MRPTTPTRYQGPTVRGMLFIIALVLPLAGCQGERLRETTQPGQGELFIMSPSPVSFAQLAGAARAPI